VWLITCGLLNRLRADSVYVNVAIVAGLTVIGVVALVINFQGQ
jgi:hypothetical protein